MLAQNNLISPPTLPLRRLSLLADPHLEHIQLFGGGENSHDHNPFAGDALFHQRRLEQVDPGVRHGQPVPFPAIFWDLVDVAEGFPVRGCGTDLHGAATELVLTPPPDVDDLHDHRVVLEVLDLAISEVHLLPHHVRVLRADLVEVLQFPRRPLAPHTRQANDGEHYNEDEPKCNQNQSVPHGTPPCCLFFVPCELKKKIFLQFAFFEIPEGGGMVCVAAHHPVPRPALLGLRRFSGVRIVINDPEDDSNDGRMLVHHNLEITEFVGRTHPLFQLPEELLPSFLFAGDEVDARRFQHLNVTLRAAAKPHEHGVIDPVLPFLSETHVHSSANDVAKMPKRGKKHTIKNSIGCKVLPYICERVIF